MTDEEREKLEAYGWTEPQTLRDAAENLLIAIGMGWDLDGCVENLRAALTQSDAEPVAWRWRYKGPWPWTFIDDRFSVQRLASHNEIEVEPLYTAPPRPDTQSDATLIELEEKVHFWQGEAEKWMKTVQSIDRPPRPDRQSYTEAERKVFVSTLCRSNASVTLDEIEAAMDRVLERCGLKIQIDNLERRSAW